MKNKIKIVRRIGLPETNSSSSHAVSISMSDSNLIKPGDPEWDIEIINGVLKIPKRSEDFGWGYFKTNTLLTKLHYLCGIYCSDIVEFNGKKSISKFKKLLMKLFEVKDVEFEWITEYTQRLKEAEDPEDVYYDYPEIDHNSHDIFEEITENEDVIKHYLFSRDSWLYGGNDNSDSPEGFYNETAKKDTRTKAIVSAFFGEPIGRVDWTISSFPIHGRHSVIHDITMYDSFGIVNSLLYDSEEKKFAIFTEDIVSDFLKDPNSRYLTFSHIPKFIRIGRSNYLIYTNRAYGELFEGLKKEAGENWDFDQISKETMGKLVEEKDYHLLKVTVKLLDYGSYEV